MKKKIKYALLAGGIIAVPALLNYLIFKSTQEKSGLRSKERYYNWVYGDIRYIIKGRGTPLLLVHGIGAGNSLLEWEKSIDALSAKYKVYAIDLLGFGGSDKPAVSYSSYLYVKLINDFIKDVIRESVYAVGSADSGAFLAAAAHFEPQYYEKLLLISPTGVGTSNNCASYQQTLLKKVLESPILGTSLFNILSSKCYIKCFLERYCLPDGETASLNTIDRYYYPAHFGGPGAKYPIAAFLTNYLNTNLENLLSKLTVPIHVIWGSENELNPVENANVIKQKHPAAEISIFNGAKFVPQAEYPKEFYKVCRQYFQ